VAVQRQPVSPQGLGQGERDPGLIADRCDVLVVGAGPAGLAAAIGLRLSTALDVVVAEAGDEPVERFGESLPPDILVALDRLGLTDTFRADGHLPCPGIISLWGADKPGHNDFILNPMGPAWHVCRARFEAMLRARAMRAGASILTRTRAVAARPVDDGFTVSLRHAIDGTRPMRAAWVLDATGARSWFARRQGARRREHDRMIAIVRIAALRCGTFTAQTVVEATHGGWWYVARLPDERIVTVLIADPSEARVLTAAGYAEWRRRLAATRMVAPRLDRCRQEDERFRAHPATSSILDRVAGERWLAIGDAASVYDPIAAQGIHKALADAADATKVIAAETNRTHPPPPWKYADRIAARFEDYLANRAHLYALERRWPTAQFWRARMANSHPAPEHPAQ
jgi:flavin-dependent dehydrogenase